MNTYAFQNTQKAAFSDLQHIHIGFRPDTNAVWMAAL
jgi:hypothetical protein